MRKHSRKTEPVAKIKRTIKIIRHIDFLATAQKLDPRLKFKTDFDRKRKEFHQEIENILDLYKKNKENFPEKEKVLKEEKIKQKPLKFRAVKMERQNSLERCLLTFLTNSVLTKVKNIDLVDQENYQKKNIDEKTKQNIEKECQRLGQLIDKFSKNKIKKVKNMKNEMNEEIQKLNEIIAELNKSHLQLGSEEIFKINQILGDERDKLKEEIVKAEEKIKELKEKYEHEKKLKEKYEETIEEHAETIEKNEEMVAKLNKTIERGNKIVAEQEKTISDGLKLLEEKERLVEKLSNVNAEYVARTDMFTLERKRHRDFLGGIRRQMKKFFEDNKGKGKKIKSLQEELASSSKGSPRYWSESPRAESPNKKTYFDLEMTRTSSAEENQAESSYKAPTERKAKRLSQSKQKSRTNSDASVLSLDRRSSTLSFDDKSASMEEFENSVVDLITELIEQKDYSLDIDSRDDTIRRLRSELEEKKKEYDKLKEDYETVDQELHLSSSISNTESLVSVSKYKKFLGKIFGGSQNKFDEINAAIDEVIEDEKKNQSETKKECQRWCCQNGEAEKILQRANGLEGDIFVLKKLYEEIQEELKKTLEERNKERDESLITEKYLDELSKENNKLEEKLKKSWAYFDAKLTRGKEFIDQLKNDLRIHEGLNKELKEEKNSLRKDLETVCLNNVLGRQHIVEVYEAKLSQLQQEKEELNQNHIRTEQELAEEKGKILDLNQEIHKRKKITSQNQLLEEFYKKKNEEEQKIFDDSQEKYFEESNKNGQGKELASRFKSSLPNINYKKSFIATGLAATHVVAYQYGQIGQKKDTCPVNLPLFCDQLIKNPPPNYNRVENMENSQSAILVNLVNQLEQQLKASQSQLNRTQQDLEQEGEEHYHTINNLKREGEDHHQTLLNLEAEREYHEET
ncbi:8931_t:CDS:2 [Entrophospora sp. SA101]|nr:8931_t:CDS:2 [Entrophospora sp. SA101]